MMKFYHWFSCLVLTCAFQVKLYHSRTQNDWFYEWFKELKCNSSRGHYMRLDDGSCPHLTEWDPHELCCTGCFLCGPGTMQTENKQCSPCIPCNENHFSKNKIHNEICFPCLKCEKLHRRPDENYVCDSTHDAKCGECEPGYFEHPSISYIHEVECLPCYWGNKEPECLKYFRSLTTKPKTTTPMASEEELGPRPANTAAAVVESPPTYLVQIPVAIIVGLILGAFIKHL